MKNITDIDGIEEHPSDKGLVFTKESYSRDVVVEILVFLGEVIRHFDSKSDDVILHNTRQILEKNLKESLLEAQIDDLQTLLNDKIDKLKTRLKSDKIGN